VVLSRSDAHIIEPPDRRRPHLTGDFESTPDHLWRIRKWVICSPSMMSRRPATGLAWPRDVSVICSATVPTERCPRTFAV
jgi:hypothetical protein